MHKVLLILFLLAASLCADTITIAVSANVSYAIQELKREFIKEHPETKVRIVFGSSGKLTSQIRNGAPYGLFMSANMKYPKILFNDGLATVEPVVYAQGALAYFSLKPRDFSKGIHLLVDPKIQRIALANPKTAPYGIAAIEAIRAAGLYQALEKKFVYAESISQVVSYALSAAEIGFIAKSSLYTSTMKNYKENINWKEVDTKLYQPIQQGIVLLKFSENSEEYRAFYTFILGEKAKTIFKKYGYIL